MARQDIVEFLANNQAAIAILDATNPTHDRRASLFHAVRKKAILLSFYYNSFPSLLQLERKLYLSRYRMKVQSS